MRAGALNRRIRIEASLETRDPKTREKVRTWPPAGGLLLAEVWAERLSQQGRELYLARQRVADVTVGWRIRWQQALAAVTPGEQYRIVDDAGRAYDILEVQGDDRRWSLILYAKARAT